MRIAPTADACRATLPAEKVDRVAEASDGYRRDLSRLCFRR
jgi:hypothetical protein